MSAGQRVVWRRLLTLGVVAAAFGFLYHTAAANWAELRAHEWRVHGGLLAASLAAHVLVLAFGVWIWSRVLGHLGYEGGRFPPLLRVWAVANVARYIPGGVWQFVAAAQLARGVGVPGMLALTSMLVHVLLSLLAAATVSALVLPLGALLPGVPADWLVRAGLLAVAVVAVHPRVINGALRLVPRFLHRDVMVWRATWAQGVGLLALANLSWAAYGVAYTLFVGALTPVSPAAVLPFTAVNALSFAAGAVAVPAPGGLGVKEAAMTLLLTPHLPAGVAAVVSLAARLWSIAAEVLLAGAAAMLALPAGTPRGSEP
jgi:glycosyltransferase 2 family protein